MRVLYDIEVGTRIQRNGIEVNLYNEYLVNYLEFDKHKEIK